MSAGVKMKFSGGTRSRRRCGFTLIELIVVVSIIALLVGILVPVIHKASKRAASTKLAADLQTIGTALEAYKTDFGSYPLLPRVASRLAGRDTGANLLAWALLGPYPATAVSPAPSDGADGYGTRQRAGGQGHVFGPYVTPDKFPVTTGTYVSMLDGFGNPILYFPAKPGPRNVTFQSGATATTDTIKPKFPTENTTATIQVRTNFVNYSTSTATAEGEQALFNLDDNIGVLTDITSVPSRLRLSPADAQYLGTNGSNRLTTVDLAKLRSQVQYRLEQGGDFAGGYLLWSAGPDGWFFTDDDATNFVR